MNALDIVELVGKRALVSFEKIKVKVLIRDARISFGRIDWKVSPENGEGEQWVDANRGKLLEIKICDKCKKNYQEMCICDI